MVLDLVTYKDGDTEHKDVDDEDCSSAFRQVEQKQQMRKRPNFSLMICLFQQPSQISP